MGVTIVGSKPKVDHFDREEDKDIKQWLELLRDRHTDMPDWRRALRSLKVCLQVIACAPSRKDAAAYLEAEIGRCVMRREAENSPASTREAARVESSPSPRETKE